MSAPHVSFVGITTVRLGQSFRRATVMQEELAEGEEIAHCPSCSLYITVIYDPVYAWHDCD